MREFGDAGIRIWRWFATRLLTRRKPLNYCGNFGRSDRIRTYDPLIPNQQLAHLCKPCQKRP